MPQQLVWHDAPVMLLHAMNQTVDAAQYVDLDAASFSKIMKGIGTAILIFLLVIFLVGLLVGTAIGYFIGKAVGRNQG